MALDARRGRAAACRRLTVAAEEAVAVVDPLGVSEISSSPVSAAASGDGDEPDNASFSSSSSSGGGTIRGPSGCDVAFPELGPGGERLPSVSLPGCSSLIWASCSP
ncbi:hypothetical protein EYF80_037846 [Liparis tanakae]|uniref:Uncharacterized protein n=1 Tax=Liparis tanakae TaxID=230148 RepID=A0A4Z2GEX8_9TELE|nr:hypothetical protein EYF80_037846 [Liparis tanakae]